MFKFSSFNSYSEENKWYYLKEIVEKFEEKKDLPEPNPFDKLWKKISTVITINDKIIPKEQFAKDLLENWPEREAKWKEIGEKLVALNKEQQEVIDTVKDDKVKKTKAEESSRQQELVNKIEELKSMLENRYQDQIEIPPKSK